MFPICEKQYKATLESIILGECKLSNFYLQLSKTFTDLRKHCVNESKIKNKFMPHLKSLWA